MNGISASPRSLGAICGCLLLLGAAPPAEATVQSELAFHRGVVAYGEGRLDEAQRHFGVVVAADPDDAAALQYLGLIAHAQGDQQAAVDYLRRARAAEPGDPEIAVDLAAALLAADRADEAEAELSALLAGSPDHARAQLFQGIADYRQREYGEALPHFRRAEELDPELRLQSRYYVGLTEAFLGDLNASGEAFADAQEESPNHPLGRSARALRLQLDPRAEGRRWAASVLGGLEFDSNPTVVGDDAFSSEGIPVSGAEHEDGLGVLRLKGEVEAWRNDMAAVRAGYDGYFSFHFDETEVDQNTQVAWIATEVLRDPLRIGLRYDYGYTWLDGDKFRSLNRLTPTVALRNADWGISQVFYEYQHLNYLIDIDPEDAEDALDRDGHQHSVGVNQFVFLPRPLSYARAGFTYSHLDPKGTEFEHDGYEFSAGLGAALPLGIDAALVYRFNYRDYDNRSFIDGTDRNPGKRRDDHAHQLTVDLSVPVTDHLTASIAGSFTFNESDISFYDYDRQIVGGYLNYDF